MTPREALPLYWLDFLGTGKIGIGVDLGTTTKETSNPTSVVVTQHQPGESLYYERLIFNFKSSEQQVSRAVFRMIVEDILSTGRRPKALSIDASNETFFAQQVAADLAGKVPVNLVKGGEKLSFRGAEAIAKVLLGTLYTAAYEDNFIAIPPSEWVVKDRRLVKRDRGSFMAEVDESGRHGDTFDGGKLAYWSLEGGTGNVEAVAAGPGGMGGGRSLEDLEKRPFGHLFETQVTLYS